MMSGKQKSQQFVKNTQACALGQSVLMILAGEAFGAQAAERRSAAIAAVGVVIVGGDGAAGLVGNDAAGVQVVLQQVEDTVINAVAATLEGFREPLGCIVLGSGAVQGICRVIVNNR